MLEESLENLKSAEGITALGDYVSIDERQQGYVTYRLEVRFEQFQGATHSRLRVTDSKNDGRAGIRQRSFTWPVANPDDPVELVQIADRILQAAAPGAEIQDDRTVFGRCFDGLFGIGFVNSIPVLAQLPGPPQQTLAVRIHREKSGTLVTLTNRAKGGMPIWFILPLPSIQGLRDKLTKS